MAPFPPTPTLAAQWLNVCVRNTFLHICEDEEESMYKCRTAPVRAWRDLGAAAQYISEPEDEPAPEWAIAPSPAPRHELQGAQAPGGVRGAAVRAGAQSRSRGGDTAPWPLKFAAPSAALASSAAAPAAPAAWEPAAPAPAKLSARGPSMASEADARRQRTTLMLRNVPNQYTRALLQDTIDAVGFAGRYDFVYLPIDFQTRAGLGYAFLNFVEPADAVRFRKVFHGFSNWRVPCAKVCNVGWGEAHQGLSAHIERYRNSPLMHESVPDMYRPILLSQGSRVPFPVPTKRIKPPRKGSERIVF